MATAEQILERKVRAMLVAGPTVAVSSLQEKLSDPYPPASVEGEYPARRSGELRRNTVVDVVDTAADGELSVRYGYREEVAYGTLLEQQLGRLGLRRSFEDDRELIASVANSAARLQR